MVSYKNCVGKIISLIIISILSVGCATTRLVGYGTVTHEMKIAKTDYTPKGSTDTGALVGGGGGALAGAGLGAVVTIATFGLAAPSIPLLAAAGGATGAAVGGSVGYIYGINKQGNGLFTYIVKPFGNKDNKHNILVRQFEKHPIAVHTKVKIMRQGKLIHIEKL